MGAHWGHNQFAKKAIEAGLAIVSGELDFST
jgi:hypothetical protein